ncbi:MAG: hypothetical protein R3Y26_00375 [Rikenellaceae bacterium]
MVNKINYKNFSFLLSEIRENNLFSSSVNKQYFFSGNKGTGVESAPNLIFSKLKSVRRADNITYIDFGESARANEDKAQLNNKIASTYKHLTEKSVLVISFKDVEPQDLDRLAARDYLLKTLTHIVYKKEITCIVLCNPDLLFYFQDMINYFNYEVNFPNYSNEELTEIFMKRAKDINYSIPEGSEDIINSYFASLPRDKNFMNAYHAEIYLQRVLAHHSAHVSSISVSDLSGKNIFLITKESLIAACNSSNKETSVTEQVQHNGDSNSSALVNSLIDKIASLSDKLDITNKSVSSIEDLLLTEKTDADSTNKLENILLSLEDIRNACKDKADLENLVNNYNGQIHKYQTDLLYRTKFPLINDIIYISDTLKEAVKYCNTLDVEQRFDYIIENFINKLIIVIQSNLKRQGVLEYTPKLGTEYDADCQVEYDEPVITDKPELDDVIKEVSQPGYYWQIPFANATVNMNNDDVVTYKRLIRNAVVSTYKYSK